MSILAKALSVSTKSRKSDTQYERNEKNEINSQIAIPGEYDVPRACLGPSACSVLGICGRISCLVGGDHDRFSDQIEPARDHNNKHRVPDRYFNS